MPSLDTVTLNGTRYYYVVDVTGGRLWIEDAATKQQWQWRSHAQPPEYKHGVRCPGKHMPEGTCLTAIQDAFRMGERLDTALQAAFGDTWPTRVQLLEREDKTLRLLVEVALAYSGPREKETLVLTAVPLDEWKRTHRDVKKIHKTLQWQRLCVLLQSIAFVVVLGLLLLACGYVGCMAAMMVRDHMIQP